MKVPLSKQMLHVVDHLDLDTSLLPEGSVLRATLDWVPQKASYLAQLRAWTKPGSPPFEATDWIAAGPDGPGEVPWQHMVHMLAKAAA